MSVQDQENVRRSVREKYGRIAGSGKTGCGKDPVPSCCGTPGDFPMEHAATSCCGNPEVSPEQLSQLMGYTNEALCGVPEGANMGLGCGNPLALASLKPGETVLDLGAGGGFDAFLAARQVGKTGYVIGVDMTPEMVSKARGNAEKAKVKNVEFRLGEIEHLPVADNTVDIILSNCVINLSPDKAAVFKEAFRVLKPGGRLAVSDVVATAELPHEIRNDMALVASCIGGAATIEALQAMLADAGFEKIRITPKAESRELIRQWDPDADAAIADYVVSAHIEAVKPG